MRSRSKIGTTVKLCAAALTLFASITGGLLLPSGTAEAAAKDDTVYMIGYAHLDAAFKWDLNDSVFLGLKTFRDMVNLMDSNPDYKMQATSSYFHEWVKEYDPELYERIKEKVATGQWELTGGEVVENDHMLSSGESMSRQFLYGKNFFKQEFGVDVQVNTNPDTFGHSAGFPQIMKKSGMIGLIQTRGEGRTVQNDNGTTSDLPYDVYKWKGVDGTEVTNVRLGLYLGSANLGGIKDAIASYAKTGLNKHLYMYGAGDRGGGPSQGDLNAIRSIDADSTNPNVKMSRADEYFADLKADEDKLATFEGEQYKASMRGTYTTNGPMKKYNRLSEVKAEEAEKFSSIATWLGTQSYPYEKITSAWKNTLVNQFHDIVPGTAIEDVYVTAYDNAEVALNKLNTTLNYALQGILSRANTRGSGVPVVLFNPLSWDRSGPVTTDVTFTSVPGAVLLTDEQGNEVPVQVAKVKGRTATLVFEANKVPSMGYAVYHASAVASSGSVKTGLSAGSNVMENQYLRLEINPTTGNIKRIYDKINKREVLSGGEANALQVYNEEVYPDGKAVSRIDSWYMDTAVFTGVDTDGDGDYDNNSGDGTFTQLDTPASIELIESGPVKAVYRVTKQWSGSVFAQNITMYANSDRIDVTMDADWHEKNKALKVAFPLNVRTSVATYDTAYGAVQHPTTRDNVFDQTRFEVSGHKWADMSESGYGVSILNDSKYGWDAFKNRLRLTLLRSSKYPNFNSDMGHHEFTYSIYPHQGNWTQANTVYEANELNYPLLSAVTDAHDGNLGKSHSFLSVNQPNVMITAVKKVEDTGSDDWIVRVFEAEGQASTPVTIKFDGKVNAAVETNLIEEPIGDAAVSGSTIATTLGKYEIKTFRVTLDRAYYKDSKPLVTKVGLTAAYNLDGMSFDTNRADGNLDGAGGTFSADLMPAQIVNEDIAFKLGPSTEGANNFVQARGQKIVLPSGSYKYLYFLGTAAGQGRANGTFQVSYTDGTQTAKPLYFRDWTSVIGGWNKVAADDTIGYALTHNHTPKGDNVLKNNYLYVYRIPLEAGKQVHSVTLPNAPGIKVAAISLARGGVDTGKALPVPAAVTGLTASKAGSSDQAVQLQWNDASAGSGKSKYYIYRSKQRGFNPELNNLVGKTEELFFTDTVEYDDYYYYKVAAVNEEGAIGIPSQDAVVKAGKPLTPSIQMDLSPYFNIDGFSYVSNTKDGAFNEGNGDTYAAEYFEQPLVAGNVLYKFGPMADGHKNVIKAQGQSLPIEPGSYSKIRFLGAAISTQRGNFRIVYKDGSFKDVSITQKPWDLDPRAGTTFAMFMDQHHNHSSIKTIWMTFVYEYELDPGEGKSIDSIQLPNNGNMRVLAVNLLTDTGMPQDAEFTDTDLTAGSIGGTVSWKLPLAEKGVTGYALYFLDPDGTPLEKLGEAPAGATQFTVAAGTAIPAGTVKIGVYSKMGAGENTVAAMTPLIDALPEQPPVK